ncbi:hypothetical protein MUCCIDRAFT_85624 [Mucor lusitanicus CBS 277.49]|uniref:Uncharacterized protein n=1 Tax=Mucor lusitanicus CBS 277.49 TaxID=747725 RepID=A0A168GI57_MUCCL|nr:hypothetical protein MUCCIDRAFT_85624 [Mucor lusitanicus CBS 277.49]
MKRSSSNLERAGNAAREAFVANHDEEVENVLANAEAAEERLGVAEEYAEEALRFLANLRASNRLVGVLGEHHSRLRGRTRRILHGAVGRFPPAQIENPTVRIGGDPGDEGDATVGGGLAAQGYPSLIFGNLAAPNARYFEPIPGVGLRRKLSSSTIVIFPLS